MNLTTLKGSWKTSDFRRNLKYSEVTLKTWQIVILVIIILLLKSKVVFVRDYLMVKRACGDAGVELKEYQIWSNSPIELRLVCKAQ